MDKAFPYRSVLCFAIDAWTVTRKNKKTHSLRRNQENVQTTLVQVSFSRVQFIATGALANFTGRNQRISFKVLPRELRVIETGEDLLTGKSRRILRSWIFWLSARMIERIPRNTAWTSFARWRSTLTLIWNCECL